MGSAAPAARNAPTGAYGAQSVVVEAGLSERQIRARMDLHRAWALEEFGHDLAEESWLRATWGLVNSGCWNLVVVWDGDEPVGIVDMLVIFDPISRELVGHGDHAFVREEYRGSGVFRLLYDAVYNLGVAMGCTKVLAPVGVDATGEFMRKCYEARGFEVSGMTMRKRTCLG